MIIPEESPVCINFSTRLLCYLSLLQTHEEIIATLPFTPAPRKTEAGMVDEDCYCRQKNC